MTNVLEGKRAFVSGSTSGIGAAVAAELARQGATVIVHGRDRERANKMASMIVSEGGKAHVAIGSLEDDEAVTDLVGTVHRVVGGVDVLVNVAGSPGDGSHNWNNSSTEVWASQFQVNTISAVRLINAFMPAMRERKWGRIVQVSSIAAGFPLPDQVPAYCASKAALLSLTVSLAKTVGMDGVTVNTVSPGYVLTPALKAYLSAQPENAGRPWPDIERGAASSIGIVTGRLGRPEEIAVLVSFLVSPSSSWITGSNFRIDGGTVGHIN